MTPAVGEPTGIDYGPVVQAALPGWTVRHPDPGDPTGDVWVHAVAPDTRPVPDQGWKLHVSATITSAPHVLERALAVLAGHGATFKVARDGAFLARLNSGLEGGSQVGKFITVYPADDADAVQLAAALVAATGGLAAPAVPSDRRIADTPVHYRYGSFATRHVQNALGQPELGLMDPSGALHPDHRGTSYRKPDWADDPFEVAGLVPPAATAARNHVVDGRFLRLLPVAVGARGSVHRAVDLVEGRPVILKLAHVDAVVALDGRDAAARLRHEADILAALPPGAGAPALVATGTWHGEVYVAMEEIAGRAASWIVQAARLEGRCIGPLDARRWAVDVGTALAAVHDHGYVYRDVKLANVMIEDGTGRARLVDFELAAPRGSSAGQGEAGSRGYRPPHTSDRALTTRDDVYGFGALLWALATSSEPSFQPVEHDLDRLDALLLDPDADRELLAISRWCRALRPDDRPSTMHEALAALGGDGPVGREDDGNERRTRTGRARPPRVEPHHTVPAPGRATSDEWRAPAIRAGRALVARAVMIDGHPVWPSVRRIGGGLAVRTVYEGSAGIVLALGALVAAGEDEFAEPLRDATGWLIAGDDGLERVPGLYTGEMGVAVALAVAGDLLDDPGLRDHADGIALDLGPLDAVGPDHVMGAAGIARGHLALERLTGEREHLERAARVAAVLVGAADHDAAGASWRLPASVPRLGGQACYGYGHGAAGIADVLLDLAAALGDDDLAALAGRALDWVTAGALERPAGLDWPETPDADPFGAWWCHGAGGIATVLARAGRPDLARRAARHTAAMTWALPSRCHGLAGNIEILLSVAEQLDDDELDDAARAHGRLLAGWELAPGLWPGESPEVVTPDYMVGFAGVIPAFLRLAGEPGVDPTLTPLAGVLASKR